MKQQPMTTDELKQQLAALTVQPSEALQLFANWLLGMELDLRAQNQFDEADAVHYLALHLMANKDQPK